MKKTGIFLLGFLGTLLVVFGIGFALQSAGLVWISGIMARTSLLVAIGGGIAAVKSCCDPMRPKLSKYEKAELDAFQRAEEWRNKKTSG